MATNAIFQLKPGAAVRSRVSEAEWKARVELAALYRLVHLNRWTDGIATHISLRVPDEDSFLINPFGFLFEEVTASSLVKVDIDGAILDDPTGLGINIAGYIIHSAVHRARPDVHCLLHTHTKAGIAVSAQEEGLLPISQQASALIGRIGYHDYEGIAIRPDEQERLVANLGNHPAMILRNHGLLVAESSAANAFRLMSILERSCEIQIAAQAGGGALRHITDESIRNTQAALADFPNAFDKDWEAMLRLLARQAPGYDS